jgi:hypothetical protein
MVMTLSASHDEFTDIQIPLDLEIFLRLTLIFHGNDQPSSGLASRIAVHVASLAPWKADLISRSTSG